MKILVTGGSGFIGSKLLNELMLLGHQVICLDKKKPILNVEHIQFDISDPEVVNIELKDIDIIYHLAAQPGGYYSLNNPYDDCQWNSVGTMNIVKLAQKLMVDKFVYTSSMAVYGNMIDAREDKLPNPISFYGVSKLSGEYYCKILLEHSNIPYTIFRLFPTYGAGQDLENKHQGIVSIYIDQALNGKEVFITGKRNRVRELVHISDVINALLIPLHSNETNNEIFNVSNNEETLTPQDIIDSISKRIRKEISIKEIDGYVGDQTNVTSSTDKLRELGWKPLIGLKEGIDEFITNI